jgi:hypothetical protein
MKRQLRATDYCDGCHADLDEARLAPVLHDEIWRKFADKHETLCANCFLARATERRIDLTLAILLPCGFNLWHSPTSWFELFARREKEPPANLGEWRAEARMTGEWRALRGSIPARYASTGMKSFSGERAMTDKRRFGAVEAFRSRRNEGAYRLAIDGWVWSEIEWSSTRKAWCIRDAAGHVVGQDTRDMDAAIRTAKRMILDGRMPTPEDAHRRLHERQQRELLRRAMGQPWVMLEDRVPANARRRDESDEV